MSEHEHTICVVGGCGTGVLLRVDRAPAAGETLFASGFQLVNGGKASNQVVGVRRLGCRGVLVSALGADAFADRSRALWSAAGVDDRSVLTVPDAPTMLGALLVEPSGDNRIVVAPGALDRLDRAAIRRVAPAIEAADVCLVSLEIPVQAAQEALAIARAAGVTTILNPAPAPAREHTAALAGLSDVVTPNRSEALAMTGADEPAAAARRLVACGAGTAIVTLGEEGALVCSAGATEHVAAVAVEDVRDTSGAGDAFNAALAVALARGAPVRAAAAAGCHAGALIVRGPGFVEALEHWDALDLDAVVRAAEAR